MHLTRALLHAVATGELPVADLIWLVETHLKGLCPVCALELEAFREEQGSEHTYDAVFASLSARFDPHSEQLAHERQQAAAWRQELLALSPEQRLQTVRRARKRFRGLAFVQAMLEASRSFLPGNLPNALACAEVAEVAAEPFAERLPEWLGLTVAFQANARRAAGALLEAESLFTRARSLLDDAMDPGILAEVDSLEGSLRTDQRQFPAAERLLNRAAQRYWSLEDQINRARCLIQLGSCHYHAGEPIKAVQATQDALLLLSPQEHPNLYLCGRHNLTVFLCAEGRFQHARDVLAYDLDLYEARPDAWTQLRLAWLQGKIAHGLEDWQEAESKLREARKGFIDQGIAYDVALVSLDLALLLAEQQQHGELVELAESTVGVFAAHALHREALAALLLFQQSATARTLTAHRIRQLVTYLEHARSDPSYRFRGGH